MLLVKPRKKGKVCLITALGGHLQQMLLLKDLYGKYNHFYISAIEKSNINEKDLKGRFYFIADINEGRWLKNPFLFFMAIFQTLRLFIKERPEIIISTGPGIAVPGFILGKIFRIPSLYVEAYTRIEAPSMAGRVCYHLADTTIVQHKTLLKHYPKAVYKGPLYKYY